MEWKLKVGRNQRQGSPEIGNDLKIRGGHQAGNNKLNSFGIRPGTAEDLCSLLEVPEVQFPCKKSTQAFRRKLSQFLLAFTTPI
jgi:hypothetical protein